MRKKILKYLAEYWYLILIFLLALIIRIVYLKFTIAISVDQTDHLTWAKEIFTHYGYQWHGPKTLSKICNGEVVDAYLGPFYIYLLAIPAKLNHWYFTYATALNGILSAISIFFLYYLVLLTTKNKTAGLITVILFTFSTAFVVANRTIWNPFYLPLFIFITYISFIKLTKREEKYLPVFILFLSLCTQIHASTVLFIPAFIVFWFVYKIKIKQLILWVYSFLLLIISYLPMIYHDWRHHFENTKNFYQIIFRAAECANDKIGYFHTLIPTIQKFFHSLFLTLFGMVYESSWGSLTNQNLERNIRHLLELIVIILVVLIIKEVIKSKEYFSKQPNYLIIPVVVIILYILGANLFSYNLWDYYFMAIIPFVYMIISYHLAKLDRYGWGKLIIIVLIATFLFINVKSFITYIQARLHRQESQTLINPDLLLQDQLDLLRFVKQDNGSNHIKFDYALQYPNATRVYEYLNNLEGITDNPNSNIIYLIVDPRTLDVGNRLNHQKILLDKNFGSLKLIKHQDEKNN